MERLKSILDNDPKLKILGRAKLKQVLKAQGISANIVDKYYDSRELNQIFSRSKKPGLELKINSPLNCFQIDIVLMSPYKSANNGVDKFLLLVDILSRKAFAYILKSGKADDVLVAYKQFMDDVGQANVISVAGDAFFGNDAFVRFNEERDINVFHDVAAEDHMSKYGNKLGIIDRLVRTLKAYLKKFMLEARSARWTKMLQDVIELYNDSPHSSLQGKTPNEAYKDIPFLTGIYLKQAAHNREVLASVKLTVGDKVRALVGKSIFDKEGASFSKMIYTIDSVEGNRFRLRDEQGKIMKKRYKPAELKEVRDVVDRLDDRVQETVEKHKKIVKVRRATGASYAGAQEALVTASAPRSKRVMKPAKIIDV